MTIESIKQDITRWELVLDRLTEEWLAGEHRAEVYHELYRQAAYELSEAQTDLIVAMIEARLRREWDGTVVESDLDNLSF